MWCTVVPPFLLERLGEAGSGRPAEAAQLTLEIDREQRARRRAGATGRPADDGDRGDREDRTDARRRIHDAEHAQRLPGELVRRENADASGDRAVDEAYFGLGATWRLYHEIFGRESLDDRRLPLVATVHFRRDYDNAMWNGEQMVFGDGDGELFNRFTIAIDIIGHELAHGVTQYTAGLEYQGQSGALNESMSDVFGSLVKQRHARESAGNADWLIGEGLFTDRVQGKALRSMKAPGTAYDDDVIGKDPQPATMDDYVETTEDNGGVHINSGIPNHAFYLAATATDGRAWERAGLIWYDVLTGGQVPPDCDFATFASLTVEAARARFDTDSDEATAVADAWRAVGVSG